MRTVLRIKILVVLSQKLRYTIKRNMKTCSVKSCNTKPRVYGYCRSHWRYMRRYGDPLHERPILPYFCAIENCGRKRHSRGWCTLHYKRWYTHGDPLYERSIRLCSEPKCSNKHYSKELCRLHYKIILEKPKARAQKRGAPSDLTVKQWKAKLKAYGNHCAYCGVQSKSLTQDHIRPLSKGGHHTASNIVPACRSCNSRKSDSVNRYLPMSSSVICACFSLDS